MSSIIRQPEINPVSEQKFKRYTQVVYAVQALGILMPMLFLVALLLNSIRLPSIQGSDLMESHFRWQLRTFWFGLLWSLLGWMLLSVYIGLVILVVNMVWVTYRVVKGWLSLNNDRLMYQD